MLFNTFEFGLFFIIVYFIYLVSNQKWQNRSLLIASYYFYACWDWRFLSLIWISTLVDYYCGIKINKYKSKQKKKFFLIVSICTNLGILGFFKYFNFFAGSFQDFVGIFGWNVDYVTLNIILPVGISFYTFQTMSYTIDIYRNEIKPTRKFFDFALFVAFFPQLVAGPIERAKNLLPQILNKRVIKQDQFHEGCWLIFWGLFKKVFIADNLAKIVDAVFTKAGILSGGEALMGVYAFAFQIYGDFSGYSDIARGVAKLMGFELMLNFKMPYFAVNPSDFWRRWHISLSTWLRDYLYISLGGNRKGNLNTYRNLLITMILGGLWHGASWMFIVWGTYHGAILVIHRLLKPYLSHINPKRVFQKQLWLLIRIVFMFHLVCISWLFFRAQSIDQAFNMAYSIFFNLSFDNISIQYFVNILFYTWLLLIIQIFKEVKGDLLFIFKQPSLIRGTLYLIIFAFILLAGAQGGKEFIYFQF